MSAAVQSTADTRDATIDTLECRLRQGTNFMASLASGFPEDRLAATTTVTFSGGTSLPSGGNVNLQCQVLARSEGAVAGLVTVYEVGGFF